MTAIGDVTDAAAMQRMADAAVARFGRIDYLINNAAIRRESSPDAMSFAEWREVLGVVLDGAFHCLKACLPHLRQSGAGAIVNIGGMSAHTGSQEPLSMSPPPRPVWSASPAGSRTISLPTTSP